MGSLELSRVLHPPKMHLQISCLSSVVVTPTPVSDRTRESENPSLCSAPSLTRVQVGSATGFYQSTCSQDLCHASAREIV